MIYKKNKYYATFDEYDEIIEKVTEMPDVLHLDNPITEEQLESFFTGEIKSGQKDNANNTLYPIEFLLYLQAKIDEDTLYEEYSYAVKMIDKVLNRHLVLVEEAEYLAIKNDKLVVK